jgi:hypothetical protein
MPTRKQPNGLQFRELKFDSVPDLESRTFTIPVSSEAPVDRWWGTEILDHTDTAISKDWKPRFALAVPHWVKKSCKT